MALSTRTELIDYCLRRLGEPVIEVNVYKWKPNGEYDRASARSAHPVLALLRIMRAMRD